MEVGEALRRQMGCNQRPNVWSAVAKVAAHVPRMLVTGGGGYNPWSVARCWSGVWATLNDHDIPGPLPAAAVVVLRGLTWNRAGGQNPPDHWFIEMRDTTDTRAVRREIRNLVAHAFDIYVNNEDNSLIC